MRCGTRKTTSVRGFLIAGVGIGITNPGIGQAAIAVVPVEKSGMGSGINTTFRQVGIATGVAALGALFQSQVDSKLAELLPRGRLVEVAGDGRSVTVLAHHGSCDDGPAVHALETDGSVVLYASVVGTREGPCTRDLRAEEVTVRLARPVGDRVLLDAFTGRPVPNGPGRD